MAAPTLAAAPTTARITSLSSWTHFFHPVTGVFRLPHTEGRTIEHLDIDLRFVVDEPFDDGSHGGGTRETAELYLPAVDRLTLRGGEFIQESEDRMDSLTEVLFAIKPTEVRWLNAETEPSEQLTFSTHLVHPAIIAAGEAWAKRTTLRTLVIQGGFPCPNLTAPTPFSLTPAQTPCPSPGPTRASFSTFGTAGTAFSALPALSTIKPKPKPADESKLKEREERRRLAEYSLKPRFDFAFGGWGAQAIRWRLDGRYTPQCIMAILNHLLNALSSTCPSLSRKGTTPLPSLLTFAPFPPFKLQALTALPASLEVSPELAAWLQDTVFVSTMFSSKSTSEPEAYFRAWAVDGDNGDEKDDNDDVEGDDDIGDAGESGEVKARQTRRMKAEMLLLADHQSSIVDSPLTGPDVGLGTIAGLDVGAARNLVEIVYSPETSETESEQDEAITPEFEMTKSMVEPNGGGREDEDGSEGEGGLGLGLRLGLGNAEKDAGGLGLSGTMVVS